MDIQLANFWVDVVLASFTFLAVLVALFAQKFWDWINEPQIIVGIDNEFPNVVQGIKANSVVFYFRMKVINKGKSIAKNCHVKINLVTPENTELNLKFEPDDLKWSSAPRDMNYRIDPERDIASMDKTQLTPIFREVKDISPNKGWAFCDLFEISNGFIKFASSSTRENLPYHQTFFVTVEVFGDNLKSKEVKFEISPSHDMRQVRIDRIQ